MKLRFYLAARFSRQMELRGYAAQLRALGHSITSRWVDGDDERPYEQMTGADNRRCAEVDVIDVMACDCVILFSDPIGVPSTSRGGRHVEMGIGLALGKNISIVGERENVFHWLDNVKVFPTWSDALIHYAKAAALPDDISSS